LLENACRFAERQVTLEVVPGDRMIGFTVQDDGPGIAPEDAEHVFEAGFRSAPAGVALLTSAGLGLPLARRLTRRLGGDVHIADSPAGARIVVDLPRD
jgi:signal transduction histidine kinase